MPLELAQGKKARTSAPQTDNVGARLQQDIFSGENNNICELISQYSGKARGTA